MPSGDLLKPGIRDFITANEDADVAALALKKPPAPGWPWPLVLDQIKARQKAKSKLPSWHATEGVVFPPANLIEQASSDATAAYKAGLVSGKNFADLTAGAGADFAAFLKNFKHGLAVEKDENAAGILAHNLKIIAGGDFEIQNADAEEIISSLPPLDFIYLDPARRSDKGKGRFMLEDCAPDILKMLPMARSKAKTIMIKTSPVLDIDHAVKALETVAEVHVIEWRGECREVLYILGAAPPEEIFINAISIDDAGRPVKTLRFTRAGEKEIPPVFGAPEKYLYEPSPAFQKAGGFKTMAQEYGVKKLHPHTHLYTSAEKRSGFPGRAFEIIATYPANGKNLPLAKANISIRNFHGSVEELRRKLKIADGGDDYIFACTLENERKVLLHARKCA